MKLIQIVLSKKKQKTAERNSKLSKSKRDSESETEHSKKASKKKKN